MEDAQPPEEMGKRHIAIQRQRHEKKIAVILSELQSNTDSCRCAGLEGDVTFVVLVLEFFF